MNKKIVWIVIIIVVILAAFFLIKSSSTLPVVQSKTIGIITDLTGPAAYWGESTRAGIDILQKELTSQGKKVNFIIEDYGLDAAKAATAAQKLVSVDKVQAVYSEFNPGAIAVASVLKDRRIPYIYDAAVVSPLSSSDLFYKTYLDYREGCKQISQKFKDDGVTKIGLLKVNLEFGQLCLDGIREVGGINVFVEGYNLGDTDFRTQLQKIKNLGVGAIINVGFEGDTLNTLKIIRDFKYKMRYGTVDDTITDNVLKMYPDQLKGTWTFGFNDPDPEFQEKLKTYKLSSPYGAALAYTHVKQLFNSISSISECGDGAACIEHNLDVSPQDTTIGFKKFNSRIAEIDMKIKQY